MLANFRSEWPTTTRLIFSGFHLESLSLQEFENQDDGRCPMLPDILASISKIKA